MHALKVKTKYYRLLKSGQKKIELRLYDEKRQKIRIGDTVLFSDVSQPTDQFQAVVSNLYRSKTFEDLCQLINPIQAGFSSQTELMTALEEFYSLDDQKKFGVIGIEVKRLSV